MSFDDAFYAQGKARIAHAEAKKCLQNKIKAGGLSANDEKQDNVEQVKDPPTGHD